MAQNKKDILDDGFEVAGSWPSPSGKPSSRLPKWLPYTLIAAGLVILGLTTFFLLRNSVLNDPGTGVFEDVPPESPVSQHQPLGTRDAAGAFTEKLDTVINDVVLSVYIPHNATPELAIGVPDPADEGIILCAQAADVRADNEKILGAFVLKGEPKSWGGGSKHGFCAIIDGEITLGDAEDSPFFERATEQDGYFFRQYPLVNNGVLVENAPKNKSIRKALCLRSGQVLMVISGTDESLHDFAQALVDLGVDNAIYLVGSSLSYGWFRNEAGQCTEFAPSAGRKVYKNESYILWQAKPEA